MKNDLQKDDPDSLRWMSSYSEYRFVILLMLLILILLTLPVLRLLGAGTHPLVLRTVISILFFAMLLSAAFASSGNRRSTIVSLVLVIPPIVLFGLSIPLDNDSILFANYILVSLFLIFVIAVIFRYLFLSRRVTIDMISAALCIYLLLGFLWAHWYSMIDILEPDSFLYTYLNENESGRMRFGLEDSDHVLYYSFVTISTLGYGDIIPRSPAARMFASIEAITGQLYLAVLVARLVGLHIAHSMLEVSHTNTRE